MSNFLIASVVPLRRLPPQFVFFSYTVPDRLKKTVRAGSVVRIPFKNQSIAGVVTELISRTSSVRLLKEIEGVTDTTAFTENQLTLVQKLSTYYFQSPAIIVQSFLAPLPERVKKRIKPEALLKHRIEIAQVAAVVREGYVLYSSYTDLFSYLAAILRNHTGGQLLIVAPTYVLIEHIERVLAQLGKLSSAVIMPPKQRRQDFFDAWKRSSRASITVGTLTSLFLPFRQLKKIIVVEAEHQLFQRAEQNPRYHLADIIFEIRKLYGCQLVITGFSADVQLLHAVQNEKMPVKSIGKKNEMVLVDLGEERRKQNYSQLGSEAAEAIRSTRGHVLVLYNRVGEARLVLCSNCGYRAACKNCKKQLIADTDGKTMSCRGCGTVEPIHLTCPSCASAGIVMRGTGLSKVVRDLRKQFPLRSVAEFSGTGVQDLPNVDIVVTTNKIFSLVDARYALTVMINADADLHMPNYHAAESLRHYILKLRSLAPLCFIQTFDPKHYVFTTIESIKQFYDAEIEARIRFGYPPFIKIIKLQIQGTTNEDRRKTTLAIETKIKDYPFFGPFMLQKAKKYYAYYLLKNKGESDGRLDEILRSFYNGVHVEVNPFDMM